MASGSFYNPLFFATACTAIINANRHGEGITKNLVALAYTITYSVVIKLKIKNIDDNIHDNNLIVY